MTDYKVSNANGTTRGGTRWGPGVRHEAQPGGGPLCSEYWIHYYEDKYLAALLNPIHGNFENPVLWTFQPDVRRSWIQKLRRVPAIKRDGQLKAGCKAGTTVKRIRLPRFTTRQRIAFAIFCGQSVCKDEAWRRWAERWLSGEDRSAAEAGAAAWAAAAAARAAAARAAEAAAAAAASIDLPALALKAYKWRDPVEETRSDGH